MASSWLLTIDLLVMGSLLCCAVPLKASIIILILFLALKQNFFSQIRATRPRCPISHIPTSVRIPWEWCYKQAIVNVLIGRQFCYHAQSPTENSFYMLRAFPFAPPGNGGLVIKDLQLDVCQSLSPAEGAATRMWLLGSRSTPPPSVQSVNNFASVTAELEKFLQLSDTPVPDGHIWWKCAQGFVAPVAAGLEVLFDLPLSKPSQFFRQTRPELNLLVDRQLVLVVLVGTMHGHFDTRGVVGVSMNTINPEMWDKPKTRK